MNGGLECNVYAKRWVVYMTGRAPRVSIPTLSSRRLRSSDIGQHRGMQVIRGEYVLLRYERTNFPRVHT